MLWVIMAFGALFIGLTLYSSFYEKSEGGVDRVLDSIGIQLPEPGQETTPARASNAASGWLHSETAANWTYVLDGQDVELRKGFKEGPTAGGVQYDPPVLVLTCYRGSLFVGIDTRLAVTETADSRTPVRIAGKDKLWRLGNQKMIYGAPSDLSLFARDEPTEVIFDFKEFGKTSLYFESLGIRAVTEKLPCNPK